MFEGKDIGNPLVSVVIPVYNSEKYIQRSVKSAFNQTHKNIQVVLVNDGSNDNSADICEKLAENNKHIIYLNHDKNKGQTVTRNEGLEAATGEWMLFLDADDVLVPDAIVSLLDAVTNDEIDIVFAGYKMSRGINSVEYLANLKEGIYDRSEFVQHLFDDIPSHVLTCIGSKLYRMSMVKGRKNPTSNDIKTNYDMAFVIDSLISCKRVAYINYPVYDYIQRDNSITYSYRPEMYFQICEARKRIPYLLEISNCYKEKKYLFQKLQLSLVSAALYQEIEFRMGYKQFKKSIDSICGSDTFKDMHVTINALRKKGKDNIQIKLIMKKRYELLYLYYMAKKIYRKSRKVISRL